MKGLENGCVTQNYFSILLYAGFSRPSSLLLSLFSCSESINKHHEQFSDSTTIVSETCPVCVLSSQVKHGSDILVSETDSYCNIIWLATQILATECHQESDKRHGLVLSRGRGTLSKCNIGSLTNQIRVTCFQGSNYDIMVPMIS